ncbi:MAG TPA: VOC family protein [Thermoleophilaceae bacterium]|nr:VOC family protein [Thermoleophilaceae bacterium]
MSERDGFQPGVPSWVDVMGPDPDRLTDFYGAVFGWDFSEPGEMPGDPPGRYYVAQLRGREVAGVASLPDQAGGPAWTTYIEVESVDRTAPQIEQAGGKVLGGPFDVPPAGRIAVVADPQGAPFAIWQPGERRGAQLVNEPGAWSMSALNTPDRDGAAAFYDAVFGWTLDTFQLGDTEVGLFRLPGYVGGEPGQPVPRDLVAITMPPQGDEARWGVDFWIDDADRAVAAAEQHGGSVVSPVSDVPPFRQAVLADPNGVPFSVSQLVMNPQQGQ